MPARGVVFKRCGCWDRRSGRRLEGACPQLVRRGHGSWYFHCSVPTMLAGTEVGSPADGFVHGSMHASYLHLHWAGQPSIASRLVAAAL
jgi:hypothetical protein